MADNSDGGKLQGPAQHYDDSARMGTSTAEALINRIEESPSWIDNAECGLVAVNFFSREPQDSVPARLICRICPLIEKCDKYDREKRPENLSPIFHIIAGRQSGRELDGTKIED